MEHYSPALYISDNLDIAPGHLYFKFIGKFTKDASILGARIWLDYMEENHSEKISIVWDTTEMSGFEIAARSEWYATLRDYPTSNCRHHSSGQ